MEKGQIYYSPEVKVNGKDGASITTKEYIWKDSIADLDRMESNTVFLSKDQCIDHIQKIFSIAIAGEVTK